MICPLFFLLGKTSVIEQVRKTGLAVECALIDLLVQVSYFKHFWNNRGSHLKVLPYFTTLLYFALLLTVFWSDIVLSLLPVYVAMASIVLIITKIFICFC